MAISTRSLLMATALLAATSAFAPAAWAGCGVNAAMLKKHASWTSEGQDNAMLMPVNLGQGTVVGMWSVILDGEWRHSLIGATKSGTTTAPKS